ncbi:hypothetical protein M6B38_320695 [Iris pallida]|uniref:Uncharacterized protein n=1 Tax=Iris pallida TaxID=29817 RepID=A0AAX6HCV9_IRIPA|nr:hypothetical protein M6B38_320695 [Iris pallida]
MVPEHMSSLWFLLVGSLEIFGLQPVPFGQNRGFLSCSFRPF